MKFLIICIWVVDSIRPNSTHWTPECANTTSNNCNETTGSLTSALSNISTTPTTTLNTTTINNNPSLKTRNPSQLPSPTTSHKIIEPQSHQQHMNDEHPKSTSISTTKTLRRRGYFSKKLRQLKRASLSTTLSTMSSRVGKLWIRERSN